MQLWKHILFAILYCTLALFSIVEHWFVWFLAAHTLFCLLHMFTVFREDWLVKSRLKEFTSNARNEAVIVLPSVDWHNPLAWFKPNSHMYEIEAILRFAQRRKKTFSVSIGPSFDEVERIMAEKSVKEVYFVGHGGSHCFRLGTTEILCYCAFNDPVKYAKDFVHQVHCGTSYGKSLINYVVPQENREKCFFIPKEINSYDIVSKFKELEAAS